MTGSGRHLVQLEVEGRPAVFATAREVEWKAAVRKTIARSGVRPALGRFVVILAMSTPHGARGWWWEAWTNGGAGWERYSVTAPDVPRISPAFLKDERAVLGEWLWKQEYFGEFVSPIDAIFDSGAVDAPIRDEIEPLNVDWR